MQNITSIVEVSIERYTELLRKETVFNIIVGIYKDSESYQLQKNLSFLLGPTSRPGDEQQ